jgi:hypothetical protein
MSLVGFQRLAECMPEVFLAHKDIVEIVDFLFGFATVENMDVRLFSLVILEHIS